MIAHISVQDVLINENSLAITMNGVKFIEAFKGKVPSYSTIGRPFKMSINRSTLGAKLIGAIDLASENGYFGKMAGGRASRPSG